MGFNLKEWGIEVKYEEVANPFLLKRIVYKAGKVISDCLVCKKCKRPVIETCHLPRLFCLKHGILRWGG